MQENQVPATNQVDSAIDKTPTKEPVALTPTEHQKSLMKMWDETPGRRGAPPFSTVPGPDGEPVLIWLNRKQRRRIAKLERQRS